MTDSAIDRKRLIITGASRNGNAAMIAAAFDERLAFRRTAQQRDARPDGDKIPELVSPHLHPFLGQREKLPFDQHWFLALCAPRPFIALEDETDTISLPEAVRASIDGAQPAYQLFGAADRLGVNYAKQGHAFTADD